MKTATSHSCKRRKNDGIILFCSGSVELQGMYFEKNGDMEHLGQIFAGLYMKYFNGAGQTLEEYRSALQKATEELFSNPGAVSGKYLKAKFSYTIRRSDNGTISFGIVEDKSRG